MKSHPSALAKDLASTTVRRHETLGYPSRLLITVSSVITLVLLWGVLPLSSSVSWILSLLVTLVALVLLVWCSHSLARAQEQSLYVLTALGVSTANIPTKIRTHMPLVLVVGDGLPALFDRDGEARSAYVGDGCIWLRVDHLQDLPQLAVAVKQWRDGRVPDGIVLSIAPGLYTDAGVLAEQLQMARQALSDAVRLLGKLVPGYVAVYQRLTFGAPENSALTWYGISSAKLLKPETEFGPIVRAAENQVKRATDAGVAVTHAAALNSVIAWTRRSVLAVLTDRKHPTMAWPLFGAGWIDYGPASRSESVWEHDVHMQTHVARAAAIASSPPWPLPQPLIEAMPRRYWISPRVLFCLHMIMLFGCAAGASFWGAAKNNEELLNRIGNDLGRYWAVSTDHQLANRRRYNGSSPTGIYSTAIHGWAFRCG